MSRYHLTCSSLLRNWDLVFRRGVLLCFLLCLSVVEFVVVVVGAQDALPRGSVKEGAASCETAVECGRGELCITLIPLARSAMFGVCDQMSPTRRLLMQRVGVSEASRSSVIRSMCRCVRPPPECSSSAQCSTGYRCVRSAFLDGRTMCLHCNYAATISDSSNAGNQVERKKKLDRVGDIDVRQDESDFELDEDEVRAGLIPVDSVELRCTPSASPWVTPKPVLLQRSTTNGYTWDPCDTDVACTAPRLCVTSRLLDQRQLCPQNPSIRSRDNMASTLRNSRQQQTEDADQKSSSCYCRMPNDISCDSSDQCPDGERCVTFVRALYGAHRTLCVSCIYCATAVDVVPVDGGAGHCPFNRAASTSDTDQDDADDENDDDDEQLASESPHGDPDGDTSTGDNNESSNDNESSNEEADVCMDAQMLSHLHRDDLIYPNHRRAAVLCDPTGTCATRGHIVVFNHVPMMMSTYCNQFSTCRHAIMFVNSPRLQRRALRIPSRTNNLLLTAFAARYASRTEEKLLTTLIRLGA